MNSCFQKINRMSHRHYVWESRKGVILLTWCPKSAENATWGEKQLSARDKYFSECALKYRNFPCLSHHERAYGIHSIQGFTGILKTWAFSSVPVDSEGNTVPLSPDSCWRKEHTTLFLFPEERGKIKSTVGSIQKAPCNIPRFETSPSQMQLAANTKVPLGRSLKTRMHWATGQLSSLPLKNKYRETTMLKPHFGDCR